MQGPNNQYGFIANTIGANANTELSYKTTIETYNQYIANIVNGTTGASFPTDSTTDANVVGATSVRNTPENLPNVALATEEYPSNIGNDESRDPQISDISNTNRTILKITNSNMLEPIKANAYYDETEEKIKIEVTYRTNAISKIIDGNNNVLSENSTVAETTKANQIFVVDNKGNYKKVKIKDVYIISNKLELEKFRNDVNNKLTTENTIAFQIADIELNDGKYTIDENTGDITFAEDAEQWVPIGDYYGGNYFRGTYQGNGNKITGIYINNKNKNYQGLFGWCEGAQIKNIGIENGYICGQEEIGGVVGGLNSTNNKVGKIYGCYNKAKIAASYQDAGGIVGRIYGNKNNCILECCYNMGTINTYMRAGGIVGETSSVTTIKNCHNAGNVTCSQDYVGGITGENYLGGIIENCYNLGMIKSGYGSGCGGIAGSNYGVNPYISTISFCYNTGYVSIGGSIAGQNGSSDWNRVKRIGNITNCYYLSNELNGVGYTYTGSISETYDITQDQMPTVLSVINSDNAFVEDTNNINNGCPLLAWQVEE